MNIPGQLHQLTEVAVRVIPYFDSITVGLSRNLVRFEKDTLDSLSGSMNYRSLRGGVPFACVIDRKRVPMLFEVTLKQPTEDAVHFLLGQMRKTDSFPVIWATEVALDLIAPTAEIALNLHMLLESSIFKRGRGRAKQVRIIDSDTGRTTYIGPRGKPGQLVIYSGRQSKVTGQPCCHIEWRAISRRSVAATGIKSPTDLFTFVHSSFWRKKLRLCQIDYEALGKRIAGKHLNSKSDIRNVGRVAWNEYESSAKLYLHIHAIANGFDANLPLVGKIALLRKIGLKNFRRILQPIRIQNLLPFGRGLRYAPPLAQ